MHRLRFMLVAAALFVTSVALAGELFGTIAESGKPVTGVSVEVAAAGKSYSAQTDKYGSYRLSVPPQGTWSLRVVYQGRPTPAIEIQPVSGSVRYDLVLERQGDGTYKLRRG